MKSILFARTWVLAFTQRKVTAGKITPGRVAPVVTSRELLEAESMGSEITSRDLLPCCTALQLANQPAGGRSKSANYFRYPP